MLRSETAKEPHRTAAALKGLRAYQMAPREAPLPRPPEIARIGRASVLDYGGEGPMVLFVPSLINPPDVLDLDGDRSLLRWLAAQGLHPLLIDWGTPLELERDWTIAAHVERLLVPLIDAFDRPLSIVGYCLGGTMAIAAARLRPPVQLTLIATPWAFDAYPSRSLAVLRDVWNHAEPTTDALGVLPMELLQAVFWRMDPGRTVAKYEAHGARSPEDRASRAFVRLEDWANDGPPLTRGAARELFLDMFQDNLPGAGRWTVGGTPIRPAELAMPILEIASTTDHIVPAETSPSVGDRLDLALGHVGMIVGGRARAVLWEPLAAWLSQHGRRR
jgi:polyhydroxyalkanoate synthase subunit PhaC